MRTAGANKYITPHEFASVFSSIVATSQPELDSRLGDPREYSSCFFDHVLEPSASTLGFRLKREYLTLDAVLIPPGRHGVECFDVAVEHENVGDTAVTELIKLCQFNIPLKVLITYAYHDPSSLGPYLSRLGDSVAKMDRFGDFGTTRKLLLVLGRRNPYQQLEDQDEWHREGAPWSFFIWNGNEFVQLTQNRP